MTFEEYWKKFNEACPLDISDEEIAQYMWDAGFNQAAMSGIELEQYIREKWTAGYEEGFKQGRSTVVPTGYKLVPIEATMEMVMAGTKEFAIAQKAGLGTPLVADIFAAMVDAAQENKNV